MKNLKHFNELNEGHSRMILPDLAQISNNSQLTNELANILAEKLDEAEFRKLQDWLRLAKSQMNSRRPNIYYPPSK